MSKTNVTKTTTAAATTVPTVAAKATPSSSSTKVAATKVPATTNTTTTTVHIPPTGGVGASTTHSATSPTSHAAATPIVAAPVVPAPVVAATVAAIPLSAATVAAVAKQAAEEEQEQEQEQEQEMHVPTFDDCVNSLCENMSQSYYLDENGNTIDMDDEQKANVETIIDTVKNQAITVFEPVWVLLKKQLDEQTERINLLQKSLKTNKKATVVLLQDDDMPSADWLIENRKSKSGKDVTGYNCFTMFYMAQNKSGFPPKGTWDNENKAAWNALAKQVNAGGSGTAGGASHSAKDDAEPIEVPETKGKGTKITAYNMYTVEYMKSHPGIGFPPKGSWAKVSKADVARYQAQADALKAQRA